MPVPNPLNPPVAEGIRRLGFRRWYERELLSSHAHMVLAVLGAVALLASFEAFKLGSPAEKLMDTAFIVLAAVITFWALRRYVYLLMHAEELANQANCPHCQTYGLLRLVETPPADPGPRRLVPVCCKRCDFRWDLMDS